MLSTPSLRSFIPLLQEGQSQQLISFFSQKSTFADPIYDTTKGIVKLHSHLGNLINFFKQRVISPQAVLRETCEGKRHVLEITVKMNDGLVWNATTHTATKSEEITVPMALVGDFDSESEKFDSIRIYFGTWSVCNGKPMVRKAPLTDLDQQSVDDAFGKTPIVKKYFENLIKGSTEITCCFEQDGYFREPSNVFTSGMENLIPHYKSFLQNGGIKLEFKTGTAAKSYIAMEYECAQWGEKTFEKQAGFAAYDVGINGLISGARVYDSIVVDLD